MVMSQNPGEESMTRRGEPSTLSNAAERSRHRKKEPEVPIILGHLEVPGTFYRKFGRSSEGRVPYGSEAEKETDVERVAATGKRFLPETELWSSWRECGVKRDWKVQETVDHVCVMMGLIQKKEGGRHPGVERRKTKGVKFMGRSEWLGLGREAGFTFEGEVGTALTTMDDLMVGT